MRRQVQSKTNQCNEALTEETRSKSKAKSNWKCCNYDELPNWLQDNEYLRQGHRPPLSSFSLCFSSIFRTHTETCNIWSHIIGCFLFMALTASFFSRPFLQLDFLQKFLFTLFFIGAIGCMGFSFIYHTLICHSEKVQGVFHKFDYVGIALLIMGSMVPCIYFLFYCQHVFQIIYMSVTFILGITCIIVSLSDKFAQPTFRPLRAGMFSMFGLSAVVPTCQYMISNGMSDPFARATFQWLTISASFYLIGAAIYAARVPEKWFPGKCDILFQSHQIFHVLVVLAALVHFDGLSKLASQKLNEGPC